MSALPESVSASRTNKDMETFLGLTEQLCVEVHFLPGLCFQLFYWQAVPQEEEPAVLPALHRPHSLHCRTCGELIISF